MLGRTHLVINAALVLTLTPITAPITTVLSNLAISSFACLLPDSDTKNSLINHLIPDKLRAYHYFKHRGIMHSLIGLIFILLFACGIKEIWNFVFQVNLTNFVLMFMLGYLAHIIVDSGSVAGIIWLYPFTNSDQYTLKHYQTLTRPVSYYLKDEQGHLSPVRHFWGRGYQTNGLFEKICLILALIIAILELMRHLLFLL